MENEVVNIGRNRRRTRNYKDEQISKEELQKILQAAEQTTSENDLHPWSFKVIQNKETINIISSKSKEVMLKSDNKSMVNIGKSPSNIFYNAPTVIIVSGREDVSTSLDDCSKAVENMLIASESINLGAVWIGLITFFFTLNDEVKKLKLPSGYKPCYAVAIGHKNDASAIEIAKKNGATLLKRESNRWD